MHEVSPHWIRLHHVIFILTIIILTTVCNNFVSECLLSNCPHSLQWWYQLDKDRRVFRIEMYRYFQLMSNSTAAAWPITIEFKLLLFRRSVRVWKGLPAAWKRLLDNLLKIPPRKLTPRPNLIVFKIHIVPTLTLHNTLDLEMTLDIW